MFQPNFVNYHFEKKISLFRLEVLIKFWAHILSYVDRLITALPQNNETATFYFPYLPKMDILDIAFHLSSRWIWTIKAQHALVLVLNIQ
jgi:hypothetical protein